MSLFLVHICSQPPFPSRSHGCTERKPMHLLPEQNLALIQHRYFLMKNSKTQILNRLNKPGAHDFLSSSNSKLFLHPQTAFEPTFSHRCLHPPLSSPSHGWTESYVVEIKMVYIQIAPKLITQDLR